MAHDTETFAERTGEPHWEAELHRIRRELLLMRGNAQDLEVSFRKAIEIARRLLSEIYDWFTECFDTADLKDAKSLLDSFS